MLPMEAAWVVLKAGPSLREPRRGDPLPHHLAGPGTGYHSDPAGPPYPNRVLHPFTTEEGKTNLGAVQIDEPLPPATPQDIHSEVASMAARHAGGSEGGHQATPATSYTRVQRMPHRHEEAEEAEQKRREGERAVLDYRRLMGEL